MIRTPATDLSIATAEGKGSGRFFALALLDALDGGGALAGIRFQAGAARGTWGIDFVVFHPFNARGEVVRAGLDRVGLVVSAELIRTAHVSERRYRYQDELATALREGFAVESIHLDSKPQEVSVGFHSGDRFRIDLTEFDRPFAHS